MGQVEYTITIFLNIIFTIILLRIFCFCRRYTKSFAQLRLDRRQLLRCKKADPLDAFDQQVFEWPVKESLAPPPAEELDPVVVPPDEQDQEEGEDNDSTRPQVTMIGRATGRGHFYQ